MEAPVTRYAERDDGVHIAYQSFGDGALDLLYLPGFISHLDLAWSEPRLTRFFRRLGAFARVVVYDKPGTGLSDPILHLPTIEERAQDARTVLDAAGVERAALMGFSEGGMTALMFGALWPERVPAIVTYGTVPKGRPSASELAEMGIDSQRIEDVWERMRAPLAEWGTGRTSEVFLPSLKGLAERRFMALFERAAASPRMARALLDTVEHSDITGILSAVTPPVLLLNRVADIVPVEAAHFMARRLPDARVVELPGADHAFWLGDTDPVTSEVERFLTGQTARTEPDRVLATVLFTDIAGSTSRAAELGDARWRELLERQDARTADAAEEFGGRVVKSLGDGHLALFDGPGQAIRAALALVRGSTEDGLEVRAGIHTGECETIGEDVGGLAVHIGARVCALADPGAILVSSTVKELLVGGAFSFADRGQHVLKGVPGRWRVFAAGLGEPLAVAGERMLRPSDRAVLGMARVAPGAMRGAVSLVRRTRRASV